ncbi:GFA family protein [Aestuariirhabdus sp. Z084]|uniref:GFA family protein n=1 Tax=Aestuariirhabdus haliotis TaxID=2918751 RepID=UPI00201B40B5|nr:GFA family protein [Aestuariirhabdus haliotis]MCL6417677.1 GFA family protein [Aestuariirhabdus haliotis]MCL6421596.1 GFA family protein [Aestuariirhabdus haliotis]
MNKVTGACLCGAVTFELKKEFQQFHLCHCKQCQKISGSAHVSNLFTRPENICWLTGVDQVKRFDVPGRSISNVFCQDCGSSVPYVSASGKALIVPAGSLNEAPDMTPQDNIFWAERAEWYDAGLCSEHFDGFPQ